MVEYCLHTEGYRSGHNGAVLKTVRVQAHKSSNLLPSATKNKSEPHLYWWGSDLLFCYEEYNKSPTVVSTVGDLCPIL